jgi:hypothetical protein
VSIDVIGPEAAPNPEPPSTEDSAGISLPTPPAPPPPLPPLPADQPPADNKPPLADN